MKQKKFNAFTPLEIGDVVKDVHREDHIVTDIACINYASERPSEFMYEFDHCGAFIAIDLQQIMAEGRTSVIYPCQKGDTLYIRYTSNAPFNPFTDREICVNSDLSIGHMDAEGIWAYPKTMRSYNCQHPFFFPWNQVGVNVFSMRRMHGRVNSTISPK